MWFKHGWLRPSLYRRERQSARLARVVQALDGSLAKAQQREIAVALFSKERVDRDWQDPRQPIFVTMCDGQSPMDAN